MTAAGARVGPFPIGPKPRLGRGFTLIEVLVALAILAMILAAGLQVFSQGTTALGHGQQHALAAELARSKLAELDAAGFDVGVQSGAFEETEPPMRWTVTVENYPEDELGPTEARNLAILAVRLDVAWDAGARSREVTLHTLALTGAGLTRQ